MRLPWFKPKKPAPAPEGVWLSGQRLLWPGPALPAGFAGDFICRRLARPDHPSGFTLHGFDAATAARVRGSVPARDLRDPAALDRLRAVCDDTFRHSLAECLDWALPYDEQMGFAENLVFLRDTFRLRKATPLAGGLPLLCVDGLFRVAPGICYVRGWWRNSRGRVSRLVLVSPEGRRCDLLPQVQVVARADIPAQFHGDGFSGFVGCVEVGPAGLLDAGWLVEMETADGFVCEAPAPLVISDGTRIIPSILPDLGLQQPPAPSGVSAQVGRAVAEVLAARRPACLNTQEAAFGPVPAEPLVSVIVPLFGRIDLLEHQLAAFSVDPDWDNCELIYVLDSPGIAEKTLALAAGLAELYRVPFRLIVLGASGGYGVANNIGVQAARSDLLLLLNSDVLPVAPGWIPRLAAAYRRRPGIGALGPKLLYEDGSIQHAGMAYTPAGDGFGWHTLPLFKGLHRDLAGANLARPVLAVTGACLLVERRLFQAVGGFDEGYINGDYEDMDLCLRLAAAGHENWYEPAVELYHFEGSSYPRDLREMNSRYNRWRHWQAWGDWLQRREAAVADLGPQEVKAPDGDSTTADLQCGPPVAGSRSPEIGPRGSASLTTLSMSNGLVERGVL